jgi:hypothetical protein
MTTLFAQYQVNPPTFVDKSQAPLQCDQFGNLKVAIGGVVTINGGDASAANQLLLNTAIGTPATLAATSDTGTWSLIALIKRLLTKVGMLRSIPVVTNVNSASAGALTTVVANPSRTYLMFQNNSLEPIWVSWTATPAAPNVGIQLKADATWENPPHWNVSGAVTIYATSAGQDFVIVEG